MSEIVQTTVEEIIVFTKLLDGGPIICENCQTAWRLNFQGCPACGHSLSGSEQGTARAYEIYKKQRRDDAPRPGLNVSGQQK